MFHNISKQTWQELFSLAIQVKMMAPWKWLDEGEMFGVEIPNTKEVIYVTISQDEDNQSGNINFYKGTKSLDSMWNVLDMMIMSEGDPAQVMLQLDCITLSFENPEDLLEFEEKLYKHLNLKFKGRSSYPAYREYKPGFLPWTFESEADAQAIIVTLQQALKVWEICKEDVEYLLVPDELNADKKMDDDEEDDLYLIFFQKDGKWESEWRSPEDYEEEERVLKIDSIRLQSVLGKLPKKKNTWIMDLSLMELPVQDDDNKRPYFPEVMILANSEDGILIGVEAFQQDSIEKEFQNAFIRHCQSAGYLPKKVVTTSDYVEEQVEKFWRILGIPCETEEDAAEYMDDIKDDMIQQYLGDDE